MEPLTKASRDALAYLHLTGKQPKYLHFATAHALIVRKETRHENYVYRDYVLPDYLAELEGHPQIRTVRELEQAGWQVADDQGKRRKVSLGIRLTRDKNETTVYADGKQSQVFGPDIPQEQAS